MTIREAIKQQIKSIKNRSAKEQFSFFWEYYGLKTIALVIAAAVVIAFLVSMLTQKDYALTGIFFGAVPQDSAEQYLTSFGASAGIDPEKYELSVQCHLDIQMDGAITPEIYTSMETFTAMVATNSVDCFAGNSELFLYYAYMEYAADLRTVLTQQELDQLAPYLHYIDGALIAQQENNDEGLANAYSQHPDSTKPELMTEPIPVGISLNTATDAFREAYHFGEEAVIGICASSEHSANALAFLRYLLAP